MNSRFTFPQELIELPTRLVENYREYANCKDEDPNQFFSMSRGKQPFPQKTLDICNKCGVKRECLEDALAYGREFQFGLWGGLNPHQRVRIIRARKRQGIDSPKYPSSPYSRGEKLVV